MPPTQKNSSVSSEITPTLIQIPQISWPLKDQGDNIYNGWADFFESLNTASIERYSDLPPHHPNIDTLPDNSLLADIVTLEVEEAINSLASNKTSGPDNIMPEHLKYGGAALTFHLTQLFNLLVECKYVCSSISQAQKHHTYP